jgi:hypothetical protein
LKRRIGRLEDSRQAGEHPRAVEWWPDRLKPEATLGELLTILTRPRALAPTSGVGP